MGFTGKYYIRRQSGETTLGQNLHLMKYLILFIIIFFAFSSCSRDHRINDYTQLVDRADQVIFYKRVADSFAVSKKVDSPRQLQDLKAILKRNITPEDQKQFIATYKIELYSTGKLLGMLLISDIKEKPFVNFTTNNFAFGFRLTYGIGMSL